MGSNHQMESPLLYFQLDPPTARPPQEAFVRLLAECTRFRFNHSVDSTSEFPHLESVEFEDLEKARKAKAIVHNCRLRLGESLSLCTVTLTTSQNASKVSPIPQDSKVLNVTELPPQYTAGKVYDTFVRFGPIYSCQLLEPGSARLTYDASVDADRARKEMNVASIGSYHIIVRRPSKYDVKNTFNTLRPSIEDAVLHPPKRRMSSEEMRRLEHIRTPQPTGGSRWGPSSKILPKTVSQPKQIPDPTRHNLPVPEMTATDLPEAFSHHSGLTEANLAIDPASDGNVSIGLDAEGTTGLGIHARSFVPPVPPTQPAENSSDTSFPDIPDLTATSFSTTSTQDSPLSQKISPSTELRPATVKHRKLLLVALQEIGQFDHSDELADLLGQLPEEKIKECIFNEDMLVGHIRLFNLHAPKAKENERSSSDTAANSNKLPQTSAASTMSPTLSTSMHVSRQKSLRLPESEKTEEATDQDRRNKSDESQPPEVEQPQAKQITMDAFVQLPIKEIIDLASGLDPPALLAERDQTIVLQVNRFIESNKSLKMRQQKQNIGDKVYKLFKGHVPSIDNISKRTLKLLDQEDLAALLHVCEEYPEILIAKAINMQV